MSNRDLTDWREWNLYCDEREQAEAELEKEVPIPARYTFANYYGYPAARFPNDEVPPPKVIKCECGSAKCGSPIHSTWCPMYKHA